MEHLELIFEDIKLVDVDKILNWLSFDEKNIESSHFFIQNKDVEYKDILSFSDYFKEKGTCNILVKNLDIGVEISQALLVISFDEVHVDITVTFPEDEWETNGNIEIEKVALLSEKLKNIKFSINYSSILFGYEPADDDDMQLLNIGN